MRESLVIGGVCAVICSHLLLVEAFFSYQPTCRFANDRGLRSSSSDNAVEEDKEVKESGPRPLHQNWWPVTMSSAIDPSKPHSVELLGKKLVLWRCNGDDDDELSCLDDQCAHRFAPLSEGRVVSTSDGGNRKCLQCAYHGWEFSGAGTCTRIPQLASSASYKPERTEPVSSYPVREAAGMVWVWPDMNSADLAGSVSLPISSLLERFDKVGGAKNGFMRDLPYGMEFLGENLVDISHLPFSHHSVGALNRNDGRPVPLKMLSESEREEVSTKRGGGSRLPLFQAEVIDAANHDPEVVAARKNPALQSDPDIAVSTVGFFDPCHVRYHRNPGVLGSSYEINLFMCPKSGGESRVFLHTPFESQISAMEKAMSGNDKDSEKASESERNMYKASILWKRGASALFGRRTKQPPAFPPHMGHMIAHSIFDGDGIFLHKQGDRMHRSGLTYRDYRTPTSSDIAVNAFRRWLDSAASVTREKGLQKAADAVTGENYTYRDDLPRSQMLDRYTTHTAQCKICLDALKGLEGKRDKLLVARTALVGAAGASGVLTASAALAFTCARLFRQASLSKAALFMLLPSAVAGVGSFLGAKRAIREGEEMEKEIRRFYFEDYVHAEKD
eukprot:CAMPEP_0197453320 /NCGR_PEP_ID=MMETSP1175-20131217/34592_1 /TAXON_ID=1003142 /ORGANISM="Triceratium dubium, Strain CCMP147" /LENGTH=615 /DNA_ID=CAMNT_0042986571 /DNA_START=88 /DNA_END=1935 /DNA_ORIENTATION=+